METPHSCVVISSRISRIQELFVTFIYIRIYTAENLDFLYQKYQWRISSMFCIAMQ